MDNDYTPVKVDAAIVTAGQNCWQIGSFQDQFNTRAQAVLAVLNELPRPLLVHCSSGDRASALWAIHLLANCGLTKQEAISCAEMSGLAVFKPYVENY